MKKNQDRELALKEGRTTYNGRPCKNCGTTLKNVSDNGCRECNRRRARARMAKKRETGEHLEAQYRYEKSDAGKAARSRYNRGEAGKRNSWNGQLMSKYGITAEIYDEMLTEQQHSCKICGTNIDDNGKKLAVDHCHETGEVRALLCHNCNVGLGNFRDDMELMMKAIEYLKEYT